MLPIWTPCLSISITESYPRKLWTRRFLSWILFVYVFLEPANANSYLWGGQRIELTQWIRAWSGQHFQFRETVVPFAMQEFMCKGVDRIRKEDHPERVSLFLYLSSHSYFQPKLVLAKALCSKLTAARKVFDVTTFETYDEESASFSFHFISELQSFQRWRCSGQRFECLWGMCCWKSNNSVRWMNSLDEYYF